MAFQTRGLVTPPEFFTIDTGPPAGQYPSAEGSFTTPIVSLPGQTMSGGTTYIGLACNGGNPVPAGSGIALIQRGACRFDEKATSVHLNDGLGTAAPLTLVSGIYNVSSATFIAISCPFLTTLLNFSLLPRVKRD